MHRDLERSYDALKDPVGESRISKVLDTPCRGIADTRSMTATSGHKHLLKPGR